MNSLLPAGGLELRDSETLICCVKLLLITFPEGVTRNANIDYFYYYYIFF